MPSSLGISWKTIHYDKTIRLLAQQHGQCTSILEANSRKFKQVCSATHHLCHPRIGFPVLTRLAPKSHFTRLRESRDLINIRVGIHYDNIV